MDIQKVRQKARPLNSFPANPVNYNIYKAVPGRPIAGDRSHKAPGVSPEEGNG